MDINSGEKRTTQVYALNELVFIGHGEDTISAKIIGITIRESGVQYEVTWISKDSRNTAWVYHSEILDSGVEKKQTIGFKKSL